MNRSFLFVGLLAVSPFAVLLPGCGGGSSPTEPTATATPSPIVSQTSDFTLGNRQRVILQTSQSAGKVTGTIQIFAPSTPNLGVASLPRHFADVGTFQLTGTVTAARAFKLTARPANANLLTLTGTFSTATDAGSIILRASGGLITSGTLTKTGADSPL